VLLLVLLAVLASIAVGIGSTLHWLFIAAPILALIFLISLFARGVGRQASQQLVVKSAAGWMLPRGGSRSYGGAAAVPSGTPTRQEHRSPTPRLREWNREV
jgi:hypothetical protein